MTVPSRAFSSGRSSSAKSPNPRNRFSCWMIRLSFAFAAVNLSVSFRWDSYSCENAVERETVLASG